MQANAEDFFATRNANNELATGWKKSLLIIIITSLQEDVATSSKPTLALLLRHLLVPSKKRGTNEHDFLLSTRITTPPLVTIRSSPQSLLLPGPPAFPHTTASFLSCWKQQSQANFADSSQRTVQWLILLETRTGNPFPLLLPLIITACSRSSPASLFCSAHTDCHNDKSAANAAVPAIAAFLCG
jgi:hypothetical protein